MSYHQDWIMRQIEAISATLAYMLTGEKPREESAAAVVFETGAENLLAGKLLSLARQGEICQAENLLYAAMEEGDPEAAEAALQFYTHINNLTDQQLETANFSRQEIKEGLETVCRHLGLPEI